MASKKVLFPLIVLLAFVILVLLLGIVLQFVPISTKNAPLRPSPTVVSTVGNYYSDEFRFGFSYPKNWKIVVNPNISKGGTIQLFEESKKITIESTVLTKTHPDMNLPVFVKQHIYTGLQAGLDHTTLDTKLGSKVAISDEPKDSDAYKTYFVELANDSVLKVTVVPQSNDNEVATILKSFIFQ